MPGAKVKVDPVICVAMNWPRKADNAEKIRTRPAKIRTREKVGRDCIILRLTNGRNNGRTKVVKKW